MKNLLKKEMKLAASPLSYIFIVFGLMAFLPGYPILVGSFFVCLGMFQSFQSMREENDITYTALLPVAKGDIVRAKYMFCVMIELCYFAVTAVPVLIRMTLLADVSAYKNNALMNANLVYLGYVLLILGLFNLIFIGGFFKTAYKFAKPFVTFIVAAFLVIGAGEVLFHFPKLSALNAFGFEHIALQLCALLFGAAVFALFTSLSMRKAINSFEKIDL
ncbi:MAG: ABC-2 transporter permease [Eubacterium sp.]|nr:ABC-2 transporter permease [Eubacterium sp.]